MTPRTVALTDAQRALFTARRAELVLAQEDIEGVSAATIRKLENGHQEHFAIRTLAELTLGLWLTPADMRDAGLPQVAIVLERMTGLRNEYAEEILRSRQRSSQA